MFKKTIKFEDYNGVERTETYYFNLTKSELVKMEVGVVGGLSTQLQKIASEVNGSEIIAFVDQIIEKSYGVKTIDGKGFDKNPKHFEAFKQSPAYDALFMEFVLDAGKLSDFINGIIPSDLQKQLADAAPNAALN